MMMMKVSQEQLNEWVAEIAEHEEALERFGEGDEWKTVRRTLKFRVAALKIRVAKMQRKSC